MKKEGFTLVELMGVLVILSLILIISVPAIINNFKKSEGEDIENFKKELYSAAETYYIENIHRFDFNITPTYKVYISELIDDGYISGSRVNPIVNKKISFENSYIELTRTGTGVIQYDYIYQD